MHTPLSHFPSRDLGSHMRCDALHCVTFSFPSPLANDGFTQDGQGCGKDELGSAPCVQTAHGQGGEGEGRDRGRGRCGMCMAWHGHEQGIGKCGVGWAGLDW